MRLSSSSLRKGATALLRQNHEHMLAITDNVKDFTFLQKRLGADMNLQHPLRDPT
jgi:hypothetical protein